MSGTWREYPHEDEVEPESEDEDEAKEVERYRASQRRCKMILVQAFGAGNAILNEYFAEVDHGGSCSWLDYEEMTPEEVEGDFLMYKENRGHGTPNFS